MPPRFHQKGLTARFERGGDFIEQPVLVRHFVGHVDHSAEVGGSSHVIYAETVRSRLPKIDAINEPGLAGPAFEGTRAFSDWISTAMTLSVGPTIRAKGSVKKPIAHPGSSTTIPRERTVRGSLRVFDQPSQRFRNRRPTHGGQM